MKSFSGFSRTLRKVKLSVWQDVESQGLWVIESLTFSRKSDYRWRWGCQPHAHAWLYPPPKEVSWYSLLLEAEGKKNSKQSLSVLNAKLRLPEYQPDAFCCASLLGNIISLHVTLWPGCMGIFGRAEKGKEPWGVTRYFPGGTEDLVTSLSRDNPFPHSSFDDVTLRKQVTDFIVWGNLVSKRIWAADTRLYCYRMGSESWIVRFSLR
jgi:hypothetical protein